MRAAFIRTLVELAERDPRVLLLTGDLGYTTVEPFSERFPGRFFNVGVAEQNMVGLSTGLADAGFIPFVYSIAPFAALRPYEFIRNGPIVHRLPVRIVGVGGGFEYGANGVSHYGLEDVGVMRVQPDLTLIAPADHEQARSALLATWNVPGPVYYRLGKDDRTTVPGLGGRFDPGRLQVVREGEDALMLCLGAIAAEAVVAAGALASRGVSCAVAVAASLNPAPVDDLADLISRYRLAVAVEAHYTNGGLGSLVCEVVAERELRCRVVRCGVDRTPIGIPGSTAHLHRRHGLDAEALVDRIGRELGRPRR
ncbi:MAG: 1-deoxy-D-xylulose-5-phosphate synthase [Candidatus Riflebacteria bacterium]|nr:1-deoxy-D-xylulose-5-phosphate synthase [Candidatus Riflebacteria bacterium]